MNSKELWLSEEEKKETKRITNHINKNILKIFIELKFQPSNRVYILNQITQIQNECEDIKSQINILDLEGGLN